ncbi:hypothetical protein [Paraburkholderia aromaticivorans]|uniref:hypothetical protein n=1 Tax=Paraburkholderia aromaticivorans TaxID=2026199 RepID=UPI0038B9513D
MIIILFCVLAAVTIFSRLIDQVFELSPWIMKGGLALLIWCVIQQGIEVSGKNARIEKLERELAQKGGRAPR